VSVGVNYVERESRINHRINSGFVRSLVKSSNASDKSQIILLQQRHPSPSRTPTVRLSALRGYAYDVRRRRLLSLRTCGMPELMRPITFAISLIDRVNYRRHTFVSTNLRLI